MSVEPFAQIARTHPEEAKLLSIAFSTAQHPDQVPAVLRGFEIEHAVDGKVIKLTNWLQGKYFEQRDWEHDDWEDVHDAAWAYRDALFERTGNPSTCRAGEIRVDRKSYTRAAYNRADGTRVKASRVPATSFCTPDQGRPGVRSFGAEQGPRKGTEPLITRKGKLGGEGYTKKSTTQRHKLLEDCNKKYGYRSCLGSLQVLLNSTALDPKTKRTLEADKSWLMGKHGSRRRNPDDDDAEIEILEMQAVDLENGTYTECICAMGFIDADDALEDLDDDDALFSNPSSDPHERVAQRLAMGQSRR